MQLTYKIEMILSHLPRQHISKVHPMNACRYMEKMQESFVKEMVRQSDGTFIKKGPWTAEEDDILTNFVNKYGPRDWSSIRSKGLLPRTGKSCRLRWVNKLRPNLKPCKFTAEEERVVIELQAQFGNKWAKIATYLPGRTDNDVKNFWSTRRKRMERMLQNPSPKLQRNNNKGKNQVHVNRDHHELVFLEVPESSSISVDSSSWNNYGSNNEDMKMVSFPELLLRQSFPNLETNQPVLDPTPFQILLSDYDSTQDYPFSVPAFEPQLDITLLPDCPVLAAQPVDQVHDHFFGSGTELAPGLGGNVAEQRGTEHPGTLDTCFEDFPDDMFDHL